MDILMINDKYIKGTLFWYQYVILSAYEYDELDKQNIQFPNFYLSKTIFKNKIYIMLTYTFFLKDKDPEKISMLDGRKHFSFFFSINQNERKKTLKMNGDKTKLLTRSFFRY